MPLKYYDRITDTSALRGIVSNTYIRKIDLSKLGTRRDNPGHKIYIDFALTFESCFIDTLICSDAKIDTIVFTKEVGIRFCTMTLVKLPTCIFKQAFLLEKPIVKDKLSFEGSDFEAAFTVYLSYKYWFDYNTLNYKGIDSAATRTFVNGYDQQYLNFKNCVFRGDAVLFSDVKYYNLYFNSGSFYSSVLFTRVTGRKKRIEDNSTAKDGVFELCNIDLSNAAFRGPVSFYREPIKNVIFKGAYFTSVLNLFEATFTDSTDKGFSQARFAEDTDAICILRPDNFYLSNLKFNWVSVDRITFPYVDDTGGIININDSAVWKGREHIEGIQKYYGSLKEQAKAFYSKQEGMYDKLAPKYEHEKILYEMRYYWHNHKWGKYFAIAIPEFFVKNGYNGEGQFFMLTVFAVLLFAFLFFFFCKREMVAYFNDGDASLAATDDGTDSPPDDKKKNNISFKTYFKGLWLSSIVLISPHFPRKYFKVKGIMFAFMILEWGLGLLMIILFFVYIAGHYPIVKTLIGI